MSDQRKPWPPDGCGEACAALPEQGRNRRHRFATALATEPSGPIETPRLVELYREAGLGEGSNPKAIRTAARRAEKRLAAVVAHHRGAVLIRPQPPARAKPKNGAGRDTLLTEEVHRAIVGLIRLGHKPRAAAARAGINVLTFDSWMWKGKKDPSHQPFAKFAQDVASAEPRGQYRFEEALFAEALGQGPPKKRKKYENGKLVEELEETRAPDGKLLLEILSRRYAQFWPKTQRVEVADASVLAIIAALEERGDDEGLAMIQSGVSAQEVWEARQIAAVGGKG